MEQYLYGAFFPVSINVLVITMTFVERKIIMKMLPPLLFSKVDHYFECFQNFLCSRKCSKIIIFIADSGMSTGFQVLKVFMALYWYMYSATVCTQSLTKVLVFRWLI